MCARPPLFFPFLLCLQCHWFDRPRQVEAEEQMVIEREAGEVGGRETREVKGERERGGGGEQKREKRGRVRAVATSGGTNGTLVSGGGEGREGDRTGCNAGRGKPGSSRRRHRRWGWTGGGG